jgi:hypothetical protein
MRWLACVLPLFLWGCPSFALRLVSTSPQATELLFQLGKGSDLVATSELSDFPSDAKKLPTVGPLFAPSVERTLALAPDWVVLDRSAAASPAYAHALEAQGIRSFELNIQTVEDLFTESGRLLNTLYGQKEIPLLGRYRDCLPNQSPHFSFLAFVWISPPILYDARTFFSDLVRRLGGENAVPREWKLDYPTVSEEWLVRHRPDRIYFLQDFPEARTRTESTVARWWPGQKVATIGLSTESFGRGTFTALDHLSDLGEPHCPAAGGKP